MGSILGGVPLVGEITNSTLIIHGNSASPVNIWCFRGVKEEILIQKLSGMHNSINIVVM